MKYLFMPCWYLFAYSFFFLRWLLHSVVFFFAFKPSALFFFCLVSCPLYSLSPYFNVFAMFLLLLLPLFSLLFGKYKIQLFDYIHNPNANEWRTNGKIWSANDDKNACSQHTSRLFRLFYHFHRDENCIQFIWF